MIKKINILIYLLLANSRLLKIIEVRYLFMKKFLVFIIIIIISFSGIKAQTVDFSATEVCYGDTTTLINTSVSTDSIVSVLWDLNGNMNFNDASGDTIKHIFSSPGNKNIGLRIITDSGFVKAIYHQVLVGYFPNANFSFDYVCEEDVTSFENLSTIQSGELEDFIWDFGDNSTISYLSNPEHLYNNSGSYSAKLVVSSLLGCSDSTTKGVFVYPSPSMNIHYDGETTFYEGDSVVVTISGEYENLSWSFGSNANPLTIKYSGTYTVTVSTGLCELSNSFTVNVKEITNFGIMNLITPNGDGYNDNFEIFDLYRIGPCEVNIFNRWGSEVFSSTNYNNDWQGTYNGNPLQEGTYYYIIKCSNNAIRKGSISILY